MGRDCRRFVRRLASSALLAVAIVGGSSSLAGAVSGTYDIYSCAMPDGTPAPIDGWRPYQRGRGGSASNNCPVSGLRASLTGENDSGDQTGWVFDTPAATTVQDLTVFRAERGSTLGIGIHVAYLARTLNDGTPSSQARLEYCGGVSSNCEQRGDLSFPFAPANRAEFGNIEGSHLYAYVECVGFYPNPCGMRVPAGEIAIFRARIGLRDLAPPTITDGPTGSLVGSSEPLEGERTVSFETHDEGGGLAIVGVLVDGVPAVEQPADATSSTCRKPYVLRVPCPLAADVTLRVQTADIPNGTHIVQAFATDVGGNRTTSSPFLVTTQNGGQPNGVGASRLAELKVVRRGRSQRVLGHRRRATLVGRLQVPSGGPISGAQVSVQALTDLRGARWRDAGRVTTDSQGRFRYVATAGPSRTLRFTYRAFSLDPEPAAVADIDLRVRAGLTLSVRPRRVGPRGRISFRGRLLGGPGQAGDQVTLYAVAGRGRDRVPVAVVRTDRRGRFRFAYRFRRTIAPFTYRFRAKLPTQAGYPYAGAWSRTVTVKIVR
jgi:hypothetical protein